ncbi:MAG: hypothetical protein U1A78_41735 [Polyangia bacterium]
MASPSSARKAVRTAHCIWDRREFPVTRSDRRYCSAECRRAAFEARSEAGAGRSASVSAPRLREEIDRACAITAGPKLTPLEYLQQLAAVREAEELARLWTVRLGARRNRLKRMVDPGLSVRLQVVTAVQELQLPLPEEDGIGLACTTLELAVVAYSQRPRIGKAVPLQGQLPNSTIPPAS